MPADLPSSFLIPPVIASSIALLFLRGDESVKKSMVWTRLIPTWPYLSLTTSSTVGARRPSSCSRLTSNSWRASAAAALLLGEPEVGLLPPLRDLDLALLGPEGRLGLLGQVLELVDPDDVAFLDVRELGGPHDRVQGLLPGDVLELDRHLALDVVARDDVEPAELGKDAEDVVDVRVLEVQRDEAGPLLGARRLGDDRRAELRQQHGAARHLVSPRRPSEGKGPGTAQEDQDSSSSHAAPPHPRPSRSGRDGPLAFPTVRPASAAGARRSARACQLPGCPPGSRIGRGPAPMRRPSRRTSPR